MSKKNEKSDVELLLACKRGKRWAQKAIYYRYYSYGLTICLHYLPERPLAEEALHDAFLKMYKSVDQLSEPSAFRAWFRSIIVRTAIDRYRSRAKWTQRKETLFSESIDIEENKAIARLEKADVVLLLQQLPPQYRLVFNLFVLEGYSHDEIAALLEISTGTSKSNLSRAKQKLQKMLRSREAIYKGFY
ncbi:RNA polymerase sigma factor [Flavilitoribacter nigricans]|uniref:RNA polymerase sigma factor n=1 Tax=Flavilitoribacter nigricans TaxID=70997 RepID=UPI001474B775|nr:sigma-70 family RNA polymerase sigma factor [Flavilitoribacter nigricans]